MSSLAPVRRFFFLPFVLLWTLSIHAVGDDDRSSWRVGVASVDITPQFPVRLQGYGFRRDEMEGVDQRIFAKALAIRGGDQPPVVIATVDQCIVPAVVTERIAARLTEEAGLARERFVLSMTHSHTTPMLTGAAPTIFGTPIPPQHQANIDRYTATFIDAVVRAAKEALADAKPATLGWTQGSVGFASNRRTPAPGGKGGPVDHDLPVLIAKSPDGQVRAVYVSYACHCTTLRHNKVTGDWAGYAAQHIEELFPGAVGLVSVGAGADANPNRMAADALEIADDQGVQIAREVKRLLELPLIPLAPEGSEPITAKLDYVTLAFDTHPTRAEWQERAKDEGAVDHHARTQLTRLDRGEKLPTEIEYPVQSFAFTEGPRGRGLAMVFLGGELVVDYSLRLKRELDSNRLWVNGYCNSMPGYIPSERILREGGYEGGGAMIYYDLPTQYAPGLEQKIIDAVKGQLGEAFAGSEVSRTDGTRPLPPRLALTSLHVKQGFAVELVAAEPLVEDPVAIDWAPDGSLFVAEMRDYPMGLDGNYQPGGAVRRLTDDDGDGRYDRATVFLDNVPFPTGVTAYGKGVLVCAAPDILYAEDTDGDGAADTRKILYTGFATHNYQARINSIRRGLDDWWYVSCGLFGGKITSFNGATVDVSGRDFRIRPDTGQIEPVAGQSQQSRVRNDAGDWFGCNNGTLLMHYPLEDRYVRRNPHYAPPPPAVNLSAAIGPIRPITRKLQLFRLSGDNRAPTAACGLEIYRDTLLGERYHGDAFVCEPVYNAVVHLELEDSGVTYKASRPEDELDREFLASTDSWFRPVEVRTGPDGALYIVDMYRFVIEHPIWVPPDRLAEIDVRAGSGMGRIYRVTRREPSMAGPGGSPVTSASQRRRAILLSEGHPFDERLLAFATDPDVKVRLQLACSLGEFDDPRIAVALGEMLLRENDPYLRAAIMSSITNHLGGVVDLVLHHASATSPRPDILGTLVTQAVGQEDYRSLSKLLTAAAQASDLATLSALLESLRREGQTWEQFYSGASGELLAALDKLLPLFAVARERAIGANASVADRKQGVSVLGARELDTLASLLSPRTPAEIQYSAVKAMTATGHQRVPGLLLSGYSAYSPAVRAAVLEAMMSRPAWIEAWLGAAEKDPLLRAALEPGRRDLLLNHPDEAIRQRAEQLLRSAGGADRRNIVDKYAATTAGLTGDALRGAEVFAQACAACHKLGEVGVAIGPDLAGLSDTSTAALLTDILDPNAAVMDGYQTYLVSTSDGRAVAGIITAETASSMTLKLMSGEEQTILRGQIASQVGTGRSLMPEGLESVIDPGAMADLIAYLREGSAKSLSAPEDAADRIVALVTGLTPGAAVEYERIPAIWREAIAAGKRDNADELRRVLRVCLPGVQEPLRHWQCVSIGGGVINGLSLVDVPPDPRIRELIGGDAGLLRRYERSIELASAMADDEQVPHGTRYDALRMLAMAPWEKYGHQIVKYLAAGVNDELRMGAWSALSDMPDARAAAALLDAVEQGRLTAAELTEQRVNRLLHHVDAAIASRAKLLFGK